MKSLLLAGALAPFVWSTLALAANPPETDAQFVQKASVGNAFEMAEAKLALQQASDPRLKAFAQRMLKDHGDAMTKLETAAKSAGQSSQMALDAPHQAMVDNLKSFTGADFDKVYTADQVAAHDETVALLLDYQQNGKNASLTTWTRNVLPVVKQHKAAIDTM